MTQSSSSGKSLISQFLMDYPEHGTTACHTTQHRMAKTLWKSLVTTFGVWADPMRVYDLETKTSKLVQGNRTLETYMTDLHDLLENIESYKHCPYTCCEKGPVTYYRENDTKKLYQLLKGLDNCYDGLRRELLKETPEPIAEEPLGILKQEEGRTHIWGPESKPVAIGSGFGAQFENSPALPPQHWPKAPAFPPPPPHRANCRLSFNKNKIDKTKLSCSHCGILRYTKENLLLLGRIPRLVGRWSQREIDGEGTRGNRTGD